MDILQQQDCDLTMAEQLGIYYHCFLASRSPLKDNSVSGNLLRNHDCTHVIFGLDTSIVQEVLLDIWVLFGCQFRLANLIAYTKLPQLGGLYNQLFDDYGIRGMLNIYRNNFHPMRVIFKKACKMKKNVRKNVQSIISIKIYKTCDRNTVSLFSTTMNTESDLAKHFKTHCTSGKSRYYK